MPEGSLQIINLSRRQNLYIIIHGIIVQLAAKSDLNEFAYNEFFLSLLFSVSTGYYSYLYAKCFAATIWRKMFKEDPLSVAAGSALRSKFLKHGGAKDAAVILNDLVGKSVVKNRDGGIVPDITSLGQEMKLFN